MAWWQSKKTYRRAILIITPLLLGYILYRVRAVLLPFILAIIIAYLINPLVLRLERRGFPRVVAILIIYLAMGIFIGMILFYGMPELIRELNGFAQNIPKYMHSFEKMFSGLRKYYNHAGFPSGVKQVFDEKIIQFQRILAALVRNLLNSIMGMFSSILGFLLAPFFAFYILRDLEQIKNGFIGIIPLAYRTETLALLRDIDEVLTKFVRGYLIVGSIVGLSTAIGMYLIGVDYAFIIGLIAALTDLIPYVGPLIGAVPAVALALLKSRTTALYAILVITLIQQLESNVITPKIMGDSLGLHPLLIIFVLLAGGELFGIAGMILALPLTAVARVIMQFIYLKLVG